MPFNRPPLPALVERITSDIESRLPGSDARLRRSNLAVLARVEAGVAHGLYGYLDYIARQVIIDTADTEHLERWAAVWGLARQPPVAAAGSVLATGTAGALVPAGAVLSRADGAEFRVTTETAIAAAGTAVPVVAALPGVGGNTSAAVSLSFAATVAGVASRAAVQAPGLAGGLDTESDDSLRDRLLFRIRRPPQGGSVSDYETWSREVAGVTRVWVRPLYLGDGTVGVFFVRDDDPDIIPTTEQVTALQAWLDARRPVTAQVFAIAPVAAPLAITVRVTPDTPTVRHAVSAELADVLRREAAPGGTILLSHLREAVSIAAGEADHDLQLPASDVVSAAGEMPVMGTITWA